jgi:outer membrane protein OmpA-like peptidoglycan-associated protein
MLSIKVVLGERRRTMKKSFYLLIGLIFLLFMGTSCTNYHFGVPDRALGVPPEFSQTEEAIARAEQSSGAKYCPEKIAKAKELATKGVETYWACRTAEAMGLLAEARDLAKQAEGCQPPPPPAPPKPAPAPAPPVEKDSDNDGVPDSRDKCPGTPAFVTVDKDGCPLDSDKDGVPNYLDYCPGTPAGVAVDKDGCPLDSDKDGVPDYLDKCPGTPAGVTVDKDGCPLDSDKDGVPDYLDKCPGTPAGVTVDKDGCPPAPKVIDKIILHVLFDLDKSTLKPSSLDELQKAVAFVKKYPGANVRLDGYTDSLGTDAYNIKLSERRAAAVRDYLIKEAGVDSSKITAIGHGKADPVADNKTAEGRAKNRRVEVSILSD